MLDWIIPIEVEFEFSPDLWMCCFTAVTTEHGTVTQSPLGSHAVQVVVEEEDVVGSAREEDEVAEGEAGVPREARVAPAVNHLEEAEPSLN